MSPEALAERLLDGLPGPARRHTERSLRVLGSPRTVGELSALLDRPLSPARREQVCRLLGQAGDRRVAPRLARVLRDDPDAVVREQAAWALGRLEGGVAWDAVVRAARADERPEVRFASLNALAFMWSIGEPERRARGLAAAAAALDDPSEQADVRGMAVEALGYHLGWQEAPDEELVARVERALDDPDAVVRYDAAFALGQCGGLPAAAPLLGLAERDATELPDGRSIRREALDGACHVLGRALADLLDELDEAVA